MKYGAVYRFGGLEWSHLIPLPSIHGGEESSLPGLVPPNDIIDTKSLAGVKLGIPEQAMDVWFINILTLGQQNVFCSTIYARFMDRISTLAYFLLELVCEDHTFLDQAVEEFEHCLHSSFMDSNDAVELYASFDKPNVMSLVSLWFPYLDSTFLKVLKLQLAPRIKFGK